MKATAVSSTLLPKIIEAAWSKYKISEDKTVEKDGIIFDERMILLLVLPICYNNLRTSDVNNVSTCLWYQVNGFSGAIHKKFRDHKRAKRFVRDNCPQEEEANDSEEATSES